MIEARGACTRPSTSSWTMSRQRRACGPVSRRRSPATSACTVSRRWTRGFRDYGPNFVVRDPDMTALAAPGQLAGVAFNDWVFNAWGGKYPDADGRHRRAGAAGADPRDAALPVERRARRRIDRGQRRRRRDDLGAVPAERQSESAPGSSGDRDACSATISEPAARALARAKASPVTTRTATSTTSPGSSSPTTIVCVVEDDPARPELRAAPGQPAPPVARPRSRRAALRRRHAADAGPRARGWRDAARQLRQLLHRQQRRPAAGLRPRQRRAWRPRSSRACSADRRVVPDQLRTARVGHGRDSLRHTATARAPRS